MAGGDPHWRPRRASLAVFLLAALFGLAGNLATNVVQVSWRWWPLTVWLVVCLLLASLAILEAVRYPARRDRPGREQDGGPGTDTRVFGAIPQRAWQWQDRPDEATLLAAAVGDAGSAALVALPGARGAGKSQLAAAFARRCVEQRYDLVAWINAESGPVPGLALLSEHLGLSGGNEQTPEMSAKAAIRWLQCDDRARRLVVFDNVDDPDGLTGFLPIAGNTKIIITTNRQEFTTMAGVTPVPVGMFTPEQAKNFLHQATGLPPQGDDADELGAELGWLPLGLAQAAAYIRRNRLSYRQYLAALNEQNLDGTLRRLAGTDHPGVLRATHLSMAGVRRGDPGGDAIRLLIILSTLSPDGMSRAFLTRAEPALNLKRGLGRALHTLATASLITLGGTPQHRHREDGVVVSVHRLTARVIRYQAGKPPGTALARALAVASSALDALIRTFPLEQVAHRRRDLDELISHILTLRSYCSKISGLLPQCEWAGVALREAGDLKRAIPVLEQTHSECQQTLGQDHPRTLESGDSLAVAYRLAGRLNEAVTLHQEVIRRRERILGAEHPATLDSRHNLASAYCLMGHLDDAINLFKDTVTRRERIIGPDHLNTLRSRNNLAIACWSAGRLSEAIDLLKATIRDSNQVLGPDHPDTLRSRNNLAYAYWSAGRLDEAIALHQTTLATYHRVLGAEHPASLLSRNNLAVAYQSAGRLDEAIALHQQTLAQRERVLGQEHPATLLSRNNLAVAYQSAERLTEAITLHAETLAEYERVLGSDHPAALDSRNNLAVAYQLAGRLDEALRLHQNVLAQRERVLGSDHPDTLDSRNNLANAYRMTGRLDDAIGRFEQLLTDCRRVLDVRHPLTATVQRNLTSVQRAKKESSQTAGEPTTT